MFFLSLARSLSLSLSHTHTSIFTSAVAALLVRVQGPALVAGTLDIELVLDAALAALEVFGAEALDLAGLVVRAHLHAHRAQAHDALPGRDAAVVTAPTQQTQI